MERIFTILFIISSALSARAERDTIRVSSHITEVTMFFSGATVGRRADVKLNPGKHVMVLEGLTRRLDPKTLQLRLPHGMRVLLVKHDEHPAGAKQAVGTTPDAAHEKLQRIKLLNDRIDSLHYVEGAYAMEEQMLLSNTELVAKANGTSLEEIDRGAALLRDRLLQSRFARHALGRQIRELREEVEQLQTGIRVKQPMAQQSTGQLTLVVDCEQRIDDVLLLSYFTEAAAWVPHYDFRVDQTDQPMTVVYKAEASQSTGEDWHDVKLVFSVANPKRDKNSTDLVKWDVFSGLPYQPEIPRPVLTSEIATIEGTVIDRQTGQPVPFVDVEISKGGRQIAGVVADTDGSYRIRPVPPGIYEVTFTTAGYITNRVIEVEVGPSRGIVVDAALTRGSVDEEEDSAPHTGSKRRLTKSDIPISFRSQTPEAVPVEELPKRGVRLRSRSERVIPVAHLSDAIRGVRRIALTNVEYPLEERHTLFSDGFDHTFVLHSALVDVDYHYHVAPIADPEVFLRASLTRWDTLNLVAGEASVVFQNVYQGQMFIDPVLFPDTLVFDLGVDYTINVKRDENIKKADRRVFNTAEREQVGYVIRIQNKNDYPVHLEVNDQIPVSNSQGVAVYLIDGGGAEYNEKKGFLKWDAEVAPNSSKDLSFTYSVRTQK